MIQIKSYPIEKELDFNFNSNLKVITDNELNSVRYTIHSRVVSRQLYLVGINVDGNNVVASEGKLDRVATHPTKAVNYHI